jgi:SAM-dependent methyltransferase
MILAMASSPSCLVDETQKESRRRSTPTDGRAHPAPTAPQGIRSADAPAAGSPRPSAVGRLDDEPWLWAALDAFAEDVTGLGPVLDVGCGPGHVTAHLAARGLDVRGVDVSPRMVEHARRRYPSLRFDVASVTDLELVPGSLGGVLGW